MCDYETIIKFLDNYEINYSTGDYYDNNDNKIGHWIEINSDLDFTSEGNLT